MRQSLGLGWAFFGLIASFQLVYGQAGRVEPWNPSSKEVFVSGIAMDAFSRTWAITSDDGVYAAAPGKPDEWVQFDVKDGLGDDELYALAIDRKQRVWVGHRGHGVSVYNGKLWRNYDCLNGPLGSRVFCMAVSPVDGDVWIGTELGLTRYSNEKDTWSYITVADGLPENVVQAMAFDPKGNLVVGLQMEGIAILSAEKDFAVIRAVSGPRRPALKAAGDGLPNCQVTDVVVAPDGEIFVSTASGLARSADQGASWTYLRGADWKDKVAANQAPAAEDPSVKVLREDYINRLALSPDGKLWVGFRRVGLDLLDRKTLKLLQTDAPQTSIRTILALPKAAIQLGTVGAGNRVEWSVGPERTDFPELPTPAAAPTPAQIDRLATLIHRAPREKEIAAYLGEDWVTRGDAIGRYGRQAISEPPFALPSHAGGYSHEAVEGRDGPGVYTWFDDNDPKDPRAWYRPDAGKRVMGEWNDGSFSANNIPLTQLGPDLWHHVHVPAGIHRVSIYFVNAEGYARFNRYRNFLVEVKRAASIEQAEQAPALATTRVVDFFQPVYKQFVLSEGEYWIRVVRQHSHVTKSGPVYFDRLTGPEAKESEPGILPLPEPPAMENVRGALRAAVELWNTLDASWDRPTTIGVQLQARVMAYRLARADGAPEALLKRWRYQLPLWSEPSDREEFVEATEAAYEKMLDMNPMVRAGIFWKTVDQDNQRWYRFRDNKGAKPDAFDVKSVKSDAAIDEVRKAIAHHVVSRSEQPIASTGGGELSADPATYVRPIPPDPKDAYVIVAQNLGAAEGFLARKVNDKQKIGLAHAVAAMRGARELKDDWLAGQIARVFIAPHVSLTDPAGSGEPLDARALEVEITRVMKAAEVPAEIIQRTQEDFSARD